MTVNHSDKLAEIVRRHRRLSGLSQSELARLAGVGKTAVFDLEHGKGSMQLDTVIKILAVLNINMLFESPVVHKAKNNFTSSKDTATGAQE